MNQGTIAEIRSKLDIVDVISSYIPLTKQGKNFFGVCPFHDDTNPSMSVSREKQIFRCFSCGASGNVFTFVEKYEQIPFFEALKQLGEQVGIKVEGNSNYKLSEHQEKAYEIYELTNKFYQNNLLSALGKEARDYLKSRSLGDEVIKEFGIGLSSGVGNQLTKLLEKKGYENRELNNLGLSISNMDIYQDRIMFPLCDLTGKCVAFSGRRYKTSEGGKYINTKETKIFVKGHLIYNYHRAKEAVRLKKQVIVMEGFMDVIRASTVNIKHTVALMGTAMTKEQAQIIRRLSLEVLLCFDGDSAGVHATAVNGEVLQKLGCIVKVIELPDPEDPDSYILNHGGESFQNLIDGAISFSDFKIKQLKSGRNLNSDEEKADYIHAVIKEASTLNDAIRQEIILKKLAIEFNLSYNTLEKELQTLSSSTPKDKPKIKKEIKEKHDKYFVAPRAVLYYMMMDKDTLNYYNQQGIFFPDEKFRAFASEIAYCMKKYGQETLAFADFDTYLQDKKEFHELLLEIMALDLEENISLEVIKDYIQVMEKDYKNREIKRLKELIKNTPDLDEKSRLFEKVRSLKIGS